jgi:hypothetical protein
MPATVTVSAVTVAESRGTSIRAIVLIGPSSDQPRSNQKPRRSGSANVVASMSTTHFVADT